MNELTIFGRNYDAADPYAPSVENYMTPDSVYETLREIAGGEEESAFYEIVPAELWERYLESTELNEEAITRDKFHYMSRADDLLRQFSTYDFFRYALAIWQAGGAGAGGSCDFPDLVFTALQSDENMKLLSFKHYFLKHFSSIERKSASYVALMESWNDELHELDRFDWDVLWHCLIKAYKAVCAESVPALVVHAKFCDFSRDLGKKMRSLDLREELSVFLAARELCQAYDRYIMELRATVNLNEGLKRHYNDKVLALTDRIKELEAQTAKLIENKGDGNGKNQEVSEVRGSKEFNGVSTVWL